MTTEATRPSAAERIVRDIVRGLYEGRHASGQRLAEPDLIAGSPVLENTLANLHVHLVRNKLVMTPEQRLASCQRISNAVFAQDPDRAEACARAHVRVMIDLLDQEV